MFKGVELYFSEPICSCEEKDLSWSIPRDKSGKPCLRVSCTKCEVELNIPNEKFSAVFIFEKLYPADQKRVDEEAQADSDDNNNSDNSLSNN